MELEFVFPRLRFCFDRLPSYSPFHSASAIQHVCLVFSQQLLAKTKAALLVSQTVGGASPLRVRQTRSRPASGGCPEASRSRWILFASQGLALFTNGSGSHECLRRENSRFVVPTRVGFPGRAVDVSASIFLSVHGYGCELWDPSKDADEGVLASSESMVRQRPTLNQKILASKVPFPWRSVEEKLKTPESKKKAAASSGVAAPLFFLLLLSFRVEKSEHAEGFMPKPCLCCEWFTASQRFMASCCRKFRLVSFTPHVSAHASRRSFALRGPGRKRRREPSSALRHLG